jgi:hypothetical protein
MDIIRMFTCQATATLVRLGHCEDLVECQMAFGIKPITIASW